MSSDGASAPTRHSSLRSPGVSKKFSRRFALTRQHSVASDEACTQQQQQQQQQRFLSPQPQQRSLALVHQRSNESHDSTTSAASIASSATSSRCVQGADGGGFPMDLLNLKKDDSFDDDEAGKDEGSIKGLWKRAFNSLKIRDKMKSPKKKKDSKDEAEDIDPVYFLLKHASDKGMQRCPACSQQQPQQMPPSGVCGGAPSASSGCHSGTCQCACHRGASSIPSITVNDIRPHYQRHQQSHQFLQAPLDSSATSAASTDAASAEPVWGGKGRVVRQSKDRM